MNSLRQWSLVYFQLLLKVFSIFGCPCENLGTCVGNNVCLCLAHFTGSKCETAVYVRPSGVGACTYHIQPKSVVNNYGSAFLSCHNSQGALAIIENADQQEKIEKLFFDAYGNSEISNLYMGHNRDMLFTNMNLMKIQPNERFYPPWGWLVTPTKAAIKVLSNSREFWYPGKDNSRKLHWVPLDPSTPAGYICEKHDLTVCEGDTCEGKYCFEEGCGYSCKCEEVLNGGRTINIYSCPAVATDCYKDWCQNNADCTVRNGRAVCDCLYGYSGDHCEKAIYYRDQVQTDFCEYQVNFMGEFLNYQESLKRCTNNSGTLATIRNTKQLEALENIARRVYDYVYLILWVTGTKRRDGKFELPDGFVLDDFTTNTFPRWEKSYSSSYIYQDSFQLQVTTIPSYSPDSTNEQRLFYWRVADPSTKAGFICEKATLNSLSSCHSHPCQNGGTCTDFGCSYHCKCTSLSYGHDCEKCLTPSPCEGRRCNDGRGDCVRIGCTPHYRCQCHNSWEGNSCEKCTLNPCRNNPCSNGSVCLTSLNCTETYTCACDPGLVGKHCEICSYDPCSSNPCLNRGTCYMIDGCSLNYQCSCLSFYEGHRCEIKKYLVRNETEDCGYFAGIIDEDVADYSTVRSFCKALNSSLAMIKTPAVQEFIFHRISETFGIQKFFDFWIGANYRQGEWLWLDNTKLSLSNSNGYPMWGRFQPNLISKDAAVFLTNSAEFSISNEWSFTPAEWLFPPVWAIYYTYYTKGYICEKNVNGKNPCSSSPCINGGKCTTVGCSYVCTCSGHYVGRQCEYELPYLLSATPEEIPLSLNFSLTCSVGGISLPTITWKIKRNGNEEEDIVDSSEDKGSPFITRKDYHHRHVVSTLTITKIGLCLNAATISCWAENNVQQEPIVLKLFFINREYILASSDSYFIFSTNSSNTRTEAENKCKELHGELAGIKSQEMNSDIFDAIQNNLINSTWKNNEISWIGTRKNDGDSWSEAISYSNWEDNEPSDDNSCVYISTNSKWRTHSCLNQNFTAHYICEIKNRGLPKNLQVSTPLGIEGKSSVAVEVVPHVKMLHVFHEVQAELVTNQSEIKQTELVKVLPDKILKNEKFQVALERLEPQRDYAITVTIASKTCNIPISLKQVVQTAPSFTAELSLNQKYCELIWNFPEEDLKEIQQFTINITKMPYSFLHQKKGTIIESIKEENKIIQQSTNIKSYRFPALPNRIHHIQIMARKFVGDDLVVIPEGKCEVKPEAPNKLKPPVVNNNAFLTPSITFDLADETNGPVSCYFILATNHLETPEDDQKIRITQGFMERANRFSQEVLTNIPYIALALPATDNLTSIYFELGNNKNTTCSIFDLSERGSAPIRQQRNIEENITAYNAHNLPIISHSYYSFSLVSSTPVDDDEVVFESSVSSVQYMNLYKGIAITTSVAFLSLFIAVIVTTLSLKFGVRKIEFRKKESRVLPFFPVPDPLFESLKEQNNLKVIKKEKISKIKKFKEGLYFEDWLVELEPNVTKSRVTEAFAKVVKGEESTERQRQNFAIEVEIMRRITDHKAIVQLYGICFGPDETSLVKEKCPYGRLQLYLKKLPREDNTKLFLDFSSQILKGLQHLHKLHIVHRALSCSKIFLTTTLICKIGDFSRSRVLDKNKEEYIIPDINVTKHEFRWMAPEAYYKHVFSMASDIWSYGVVMWEIFSYGEIPYSEVKDQKLENKLLKENIRLESPADCPTAIYQTMYQCWNELAMLRPTTENLALNFQYVIQSEEGFYETNQDTGNNNYSSKNVYEYQASNYDYTTHYAYSQPRYYEAMY